MAEVIVRCSWISMGPPNYSIGIDRELVARDKRHVAVLRRIIEKACSGRLASMCPPQVERVGDVDARHSTFVQQKGRRCEGISRVIETFVRV